MISPDRFDKDKYPQFNNHIKNEIMGILADDLAQNLAKRVIAKIEKDYDYEFSEKEFLIILKNYIEEKVKTKFYFDSQDAIDHLVINIFSKIGPEQTYVLFQFVLAYIALNI